jgi:hypothetical protein
MAEKFTDFVVPEGPWPQKAYKNLDFLTSRDARPIRVMCEFVEPGSRFRRLNIRDTIVFFGSTRILSHDVADANLRRAQRDASVRNEQGEELEAHLQAARRDLNMARYYEEARELARRLTEWSEQIGNHARRFVVCSGGGPGIMEAANRGALDAGGPSIGLNISLPLEQRPNAFQSPELSFEFHYFFIRKFWFVYLAKALVVFPGGFGTLDELFEVLTLSQTGKSRKDIPVILYGNEYWDRVINLDALVEYGTIAPDDLNLIRRVDNVDAAFEFLREELTRYYLDDDGPKTPDPSAEMEADTHPSDG